MDAAAHHLAHLLGDDAGHGMHRLREHGQARREIRNGDAVAGAEQDDHRLANDAAEPEKNGCDDA